MTVRSIVALLALIALVLPVQARPGDLQVVNTPELLVLGAARPAAHGQRLVVRSLPAEPGVRRAAVSYEESGTTRFSATVSIGSDTIEVDGTAGIVPFGMQWTNLGSGVGVETSLRFGEASFDAFISEAGPDDVDIEDYARYRDAVVRSPGWPAVQKIDLFLRSTSVDSPLVVMAVLASYAASSSATGSAEGSPIGNYVQCLRSSCRDCGGCWSAYPWADCYACVNQPYWEQVIAGSCYLASTTLCLRHLLVPIPNFDD